MLKRNQTELARGRMARISMGVTTVAMLSAVIWTAGCSQAELSITPAERLELRDRAENLLTVAAQSEIDLICCNGIEAMGIVMPKDALTYFRQAMASDSAMVRFAGCVAAGEMKDRAAQQAVQKCLRDPNERVRLAAAYAAYRLGNREMGRVLADTMIQHRDENMRSDAAFLIGRIEEPAAKKRLRLALDAPLNQKSNRATVHIYGALAKLGDEEAAARLVDYTQGDAVSRVLALQMLSEAPSKRSQPALTLVLADQNEYLENRLLAARGLGRLKSKAGYALALRSLSHVGDNPEDPNETARVRTLAALALGAIGSPDALPALRTLAEDGSDERVQIAAALAICQIID